MTTIMLTGVSCGRCEGRISQAVHALDAGAALRFSADRQCVDINSEISATDLVEVIREQGYGASLPGRT